MAVSGAICHGESRGFSVRECQRECIAPWLSDAGDGLRTGTRGFALDWFLSESKTVV